MPTLKMLSFFKQKKIIFIIFLGIFVCTTFWPFFNISMAQGEDLSGFMSSGMRASLDLSRIGDKCALEKKSQSLYDACRIIERDADGIVGDSVFSKESNLSFGEALLLGIPRIIFLGVYKVAAYANYLTTFISENIVGALITKPDVTTSDHTGLGTDFSPVWKFVRDLANMIIVLGFVVVGIATALRIQSYAAKQLLMKLVFVAVIVNFSGLFCGMIIDASNITMNGMSKIVPGSGDKNACTGDKNNAGCVIMNNLANKSEEILVAKPIKTYLGMSFIFGLIYLGVALTFLYLSAVLIARYAILVFLFVLSPLAFAFWIFPATQKWFTEWWQTFLKWAFVGVFTSFVLSISATLVKLINKDTPIFPLICYSALILIFLYIGFKKTSESSGIASMAAGGAVGLAKAGAGMAVTGAVLGAAGAGKVLGRTKAGAWVSDKAQGVSGGVGRALERMKLKDQGSTDLKQAGKTKETTERMSAQINAGGLDQVQRTSRGEGMDKSSKARAGATAALLKTGNFEINGADGKPDQKQVQALAHFQAMGGDLSEHSKKDPRLAAYDINARAKTMKENPGMSEAAANEKNVASAYSKLGPKGLEGLSTGAIDENAFRYIKPQTTEKAVDLGNLTDKQQDSMLKYISSDASGPNTPESKRLYDLEKNLRATGKTDEADRIRDNVAAVKKLRGDRVPSKKEPEKSPAKNSGLIDRTPDINAPESHDASKFKFKKK